MASSGGQQPSSREEPQTAAPEAAKESQKAAETVSVSVSVSVSVKEEKEEEVRAQTDEEYANFLTKVLKNFENFLTNFCNFMSSNPPEKVTEQPRPLVEFLSWLNEFYGQMGAFKMTEKQLTGYRKQAGAKLAEFQSLIEDLCRCATYLYQKHKEDGFISQSPDAETKFDHEKVYITLILGNIHNYTDCSLEFCVALSKADFFFGDMVADGLTAWFDRHAAEDQPNIMRLVKSMIGLTYNMFFKNNSEIYDSLSRVRVVESVKPYLRSPNVEIQLDALILIAFALDESQADLYLGAREVMEFLVGHLSDSIGRPDRRSHGYHIIELAVCVNRLALNDVNKRLLMDTQLLPALLRMCRGCREDEMSAALDILFTLSFLTENRGRILDEFGDILRDLLGDSSQRQDGMGLWRDCRSLQGLDFNLNEQLSSPAKFGSSGKGTGSGARPESARQLRRRATSIDPESVPACVLQGEHVMISYQHECKEIVSRIKDALVRAGIKVWIDYERMGGGSALGAMADAVESSYAFVMCMSRKYKESNNCRVEAEYAWRLGKRVVPLLLEPKYKPVGWLGIMLGMQLYQDFSGKYPFETKMQELVRALSDARQAARGVSEPGGGMAEPTVRAEVARPLGTSRPGSAASSGGGGMREHHFPSPYPALPPIGAPAAAAPDPVRTPGLRAWTVENVRSWAEGRCLASVAAAGLTGEELHFLAGCKRVAPEAFYRLIDRHLAIDKLRDLAVFVNAIDDL